MAEHAAQLVGSIQARHRFAEHVDDALALVMHPPQVLDTTGHTAAQV